MNKMTFPNACQVMRWHFHPLGFEASMDAPRSMVARLFDRAEARAPIEQPMRESALPVAITRALMAEDPGRFYGENRALRVFVGDVAVPLAEIRADILALEQQSEGLLHKIVGVEN